MRGSPSDWDEHKRTKGKLDRKMRRLNAAVKRAISLEMRVPFIGFLTLGGGLKRGLLELLLDMLVIGNNTDQDKAEVFQRTFREDVDIDPFVVTSKFPF